MPARAITNLSFGITEIVVTGYVRADWNTRFYQEGFRYMRGAYIKTGTSPEDFKAAEALAQEYNGQFNGEPSFHSPNQISLC